MSQMKEDVGMLRHENGSETTQEVINNPIPTSLFMYRFT